MFNKTMMTLIDKGWTPSPVAAGVWFKPGIGIVSYNRDLHVWEYSTNQITVQEAHPDMLHLIDMIELTIKAQVDKPIAYVPDEACIVTMCARDGH